MLLLDEVCTALLLARGSKRGSRPAAAPQGGRSDPERSAPADTLANGLLPL